MVRPSLLLCPARAALHPPTPSAFTLSLSRHFSVSLLCPAHLSPTLCPPPFIGTGQRASSKDSLCCRTPFSIIKLYAHFSTPLPRRAPPFADCGCARYREVTSRFTLLHVFQEKGIFSCSFVLRDNCFQNVALRNCRTRSNGTIARFANVGL